MAGTKPDIENLFKPLESAVVCVEGGIIAYMNPAAVELAGDRTGADAAELLPAELLSLEGGETASAGIAGKICAVRRASAEGLDVFYLKRCGDGGLLPKGRDARGELANTLTVLNNAARGLAMLFEEGGSVAEMKRDVRYIAHSGALLERMLIGRMRLASFRDGDISVCPDETDASELCSRLADTVDFLEKRRGIAVIFSGESGVAAELDAYWIEVALLNLIANSLSHMSSGCTLTLGVRRAGNSVVFSVDDDGSGIDESALAAMFSGDTMGLPLVSAIASAHGGVCIGRSREGGGASFRLSLPARHAAPGCVRSAKADYGESDMSLVLRELSPCLSPEDFDPRLMD